MQNLTHAVVWIDHKEARIFHFNAETEEHLLLHPQNHRKMHLHHKANSIGGGHSKEDHAYLQSVSEAIGDAKAVLVCGPANEKTELVKHIGAHVPALKSKIKGVEPLNHPTDGELLAHARKFFAADHMLPPRIS